MALCFRFTSSTFSEILSMKPRISSTCGPRPGGLEAKLQGGGFLGPGLAQSRAKGQGSGPDWARLQGVGEGRRGCSKDPSRPG